MPSASHMKSQTTWSHNLFNSYTSHVIPSSPTRSRTCWCTFTCSACVLYGMEKRNDGIQISTHPLGLQSRNFRPSVRVCLDRSRRRDSFKVANESRLSHLPEIGYNLGKEGVPREWCRFPLLGGLAHDALAISRRVYDGYVFTAKFTRPWTFTWDLKRPTRAVALRLRFCVP